MVPDFTHFHGRGPYLNLSVIRFEFSMDPNRNNLMRSGKDERSEAGGVLLEFESER